MLKPNPHSGQQKLVDSYVYPVVWLTDLDIKDRAEANLIGLGNLNNLLTCDRIAYRFIVPRVGVVTWREWADAHPLNPAYRYMLEAAEGRPGAVVRGRRHGQRARLDENYGTPRLASGRATGRGLMPQGPPRPPLTTLAPTNICPGQRAKRGPHQGFTKALVRARPRWP